jgi:hypothetical protein
MLRKAIIIVIVFAALFILAVLAARAVSAAPDEAPNARIVCAWVKQPCPYPGCTERWVRICKRVPDARYPDL